MKKLVCLLILSFLFSCKSVAVHHNLASVSDSKNFNWNGANLYFLLTDRFKLVTAFFGMVGQFYMVAVVGIIISKFTSK